MAFKYLWFYRQNVIIIPLEKNESSVVLLLKKIM